MTPQELKNSILQLAIQGKLVEQRPEEGTGEELKQTVEQERDRQIRLKIIKNNRHIKPIEEEEFLFDIPESWARIRFGKLVNYYMGKTPPRAEAQWWGEGFPWVSIADMPESGHIQNTKEKVTSNAVTEKFGGKLSRAGTLLMSFKLTVGRVSILDIDAVHNEAIISIYPIADHEDVIKTYLFHVLPIIAQSGDSKNAIKGKTLNDASICNLLIPLPPVEEQRRIVAKIEELLPFIDQYKRAWSRLETFNKRFPEDMKKSILQLAIQGKLVERRPEEGTAEELYQQVQAEKRRLIKGGKLKKEEPLSEIKEEEQPFEIPESWKWVRIGQVFQLQAGKNISSSDIKDNMNGVYKYRCYGGNGLRGYVSNFNREGNFAIVGRQGALCGNVNFAEGQFYATEHAVVVDHFNLTDVRWGGWFLRALNLNQYATATAQPGLAVSNIVKVPIPLPPLAEQKRIVAKLEELLPLCDKLR